MKIYNPRSLTANENDDVSICMVSQGVSPHQMPFACRVVKSVGTESFRYISVITKDPERLALGWGQPNYTWIKEPLNYSGHKEDAQKWQREADVLFTTVRDIELFMERNTLRKFTMYASERWFKPDVGKLRLLWPSYCIMALRFRKVMQSSYMYYLPIGPHAADDLKLLEPFGNSMRRWGYFVEPSTEKYELMRQLDVGLVHNVSKKDFTVLWVGRYIGCKRVDTLLSAFEKFIRTGRVGRLTLIGRGEKEGELRRFVKRAGLDAFVSFKSAVPIEEVRLEMRRADVLVCSSNGTEGWGAVVSEAMEEGCTVIATRECGSGACLVQHGENGILFSAGSQKELLKHLCEMYEKPKERCRLAYNGQQTMQETWGASVAASRFVTFARALKKNETLPEFSSGPLSAV